MNDGKCYDNVDSIMLPDDFQERFDAYHVKIMLDNPKATNDQIDDMLHEFVVENITVDGEF